MFTARAKCFRERKYTGWPASYGARRLEYPTNIAEGQARFSANEFHYFLGRARGSLVEVETQLMIAQNLTYFSPEHEKQLFDKANELGRILNALGGAIKQAA